MQTIKLSYKTSEEAIELISEIQRQYSVMVRFAYNRFRENKSEREIRSISKNLNNIELLDTWLIQSAIREGKHVYSRNKEKKVVFGGKNLFEKWNKTGSERWLNKWKEKRLIPFTSEGEKLQKGNRKFEIDVIDNNRIVFKLNRKRHYFLELPRLRKNLKNQLMKLEKVAENKNAPFMVSLDQKYIRITFDESLVLRKNEYHPIKNRVAAIDMNPNYVGFVVKDFDTGKILYKEVLSLKRLNDTENNFTGLPSTDKKRKKINNIRRNMIFEISKRITNIAEHFRCEVFIVEDLKMRASDKGIGRRFNRLINNKWLRTDFVSNIEKRCNIIGLQFKNVYPQYSSTVGCLMNPKETDSIAAALEIGRRGFELLNYKKGKSVIFPVFDKILLSRLWKNEMKDLILSSSNWKDLHKKIKKSGLRYRFLLSDYLKTVVFNSYDKKTYITLYSFIS